MTVLPTRRLAALPAMRRWLAAALVFCAVLAGLALSHHRPGHQLSRARAESAALRDPVAAAHLERHGWDSVRTMPLDARMTRVSFFDGRRIVLEAAVTPRGHVESMIRYDKGYVRLGSQIGQRPLPLACLTFLFLLAVVRLPLRRVENLDALALAGFIVPIVLLNARYLEWSVLAGAALLAYLCVRCTHVALSGPREKAPGRFLLEQVPRRALALCTAGAGLALALVSIPGGVPSDVAFASIAGATDVVHGILPYGHLHAAGLVHGDTYPLLAYVAYIPGALLSPVHDGFDNLEATLWVATGFALIAAAGVALAARRAGAGGLRPALAFLAFPPVMVASSSGSNDLAAAACVAIALAFGARAARSSGALSAAGWVKLAPIALLPLWIARDRSWRALAAAVSALALVGAAALALGGPHGLGEMARSLSFQAERGSLLSPWGLLGADAAQLVFQAAVLTGLVLACVRVWRDRALAADPRRMAALGAALLLAVQLAANYWTYSYLAWVFPLVIVGLLLPETAETLSTRSRPPGSAA